MPLFRSVLLAAFVALAGVLAAPPAGAVGIEDTFRKHAPGSTRTVDHGDWTAMLQAYVVPGSDGLARVRYALWKAEARDRLRAYVARLAATDVGALDRPEQFAFWSNLYNARTIEIVLDRYPVRSIKDISLGGTLLANVTGGPWKAKVVKVAGHELSLDDIEHVILRGLFKDPRVHYAVNCASIGCPNLLARPFTAAALDEMLTEGARGYINHPRGVRVAGRKLYLSRIFNWYRADFGANDSDLIRHLSAFAAPKLKEQLAGIETIAGYDYDWSLNDAK